MTTRTKTEAPADADAQPTEPADYTAGQAKITELIGFHGSPVGAQLLREVLGWLGREAAEAARHRPRNRPAWLAGWNPPHLRLLAEMCSAYAPEVGTINAPTQDDDLFPDATSPETVTIGGSGDGIDVVQVQVPTEREVREAEQAAEVSRIEAELRAQQAEKQQALAALTEQLGAEPISPNGGTGTYGPTDAERYPWHKPDPAPDEPEQMTSAERAANDYLPRFHRPDPAPDEPSPANADQARSLIGREQGEPPF
jgi:hypothetical protein